MKNIFAEKKVLLEISKANYKIPNSDISIINELNYNVYYGDFIIILGSNGSGKSSLLKLIDKRNSLTSGQILLDGKNINKYNTKDYASKVRTLTQNCNDSLFPNLTIFENYLLANRVNKNSSSRKEQREFLKDYLKDFNPKLSSKLDQIVDELSGGEKQTLALALTILNPPLLLLLDEHTSALDPKTADLNMQLTKQMIEKNRITCMLTTHNLGIAEHYGNRIIAIRNGEILAQIEPGEKHEFNDTQMLQMFY